MTLWYGTPITKNHKAIPGKSCPEPRIGLDNSCRSLPIGEIVCEWNISYSDLPLLNVNFPCSRFSIKFQKSRIYLVFFMSILTRSHTSFNRKPTFTLGSILHVQLNMLTLWCGWWKLFNVKVQINVFRIGRWIKHYCFFFFIKFCLRFSHLFRSVCF